MNNYITGSVFIYKSEKYFTDASAMYFFASCKNNFISYTCGDRLALCVTVSYTHACVQIKSNNITAFKSIYFYLPVSRSSGSPTLVSDKIGQ